MNMREMAAARMYENTAKRLGVDAVPWDESGPKTQAKYLANVDDVLDALMVPTEAMDKAATPGCFDGVNHLQKMSITFGEIALFSSAYYLNAIRAARLGK